MEAIPLISEQNVTNYKKSILEGYSDLLLLLEEDITENFLRRFKPFFISVTAPDYALLYESEV